MHNLAK